VLQIPLIAKPRTVQVTIDGFEVEDWKKFTNAHISFLSASIREAYKQPYLHRLRRLRAILEAYGDKAQAV